jgi:hypothetical protein
MQSVDTGSWMIMTNLGHVSQHTKLEVLTVVTIKIMVLLNEPPCGMIDR